MIKKFIVIISLIFFAGCGFTPIHSNKNINNFSIELINFSKNGDRELNNFLKTNLIQYKNSNKKKISVIINSKFTKNILTKDQTGKITNYELLADVTFTIESTKKKFKFSEKKIIENLDDKFKQYQNERSIKKIFASSMTNKLISELRFIE